MRRLREVLRRLEKLAGQKPDLIERLCVVRDGREPDCKHCEHHNRCLEVIERIVGPETPKPRNAKT